MENLEVNSHNASGQSAEEPNEHQSQRKQHMLNRTLGLLRAISLVMGAVIGPGIFTTPKNVLAYSGKLKIKLVI